METIITIPRVEGETEGDFVQRVSDAVDEQGCILVKILGSRLAVMKIKSNSEIVQAEAEFLSSQIEVEVEIECK